MSVCPRSLCVKSFSETMCCACVRVKFSLMKHCCPLQPCPPTVTLGQWRWQWLVTVSCTPLSSPHPLLLCSTFIWPHLLPLTFNAELGSPLIKVKASQCLDKKDGGGDREAERDSTRKCGRGVERHWWKNEKLLYLCTINLCGIQMTKSIILNVWHRPKTMFSFFFTSLCSHLNSYGTVRGQHIKCVALHFKTAFQWFSTALPQSWETHKKQIVKHGPNEWSSSSCVRVKRLKSGSHIVQLHNVS